MRTRIRRYASFSAIALLFLIVAAAVLLTAARLLLPIVAGQQRWFEDQLSEFVGQPVRIAHVQADLKGIVPRIAFYRVRLLSADGTRTLLEFPQASIELDVAASLFYGAPRLTGLALAGAGLHVIRELDGQVHVAGIAGETSTDLSELLNWLENVSLSFGSLDLRWEDRKLGVDYSFSDVTAVLQSVGSHHRLFGELYPRDGLAKTLRIGLDIEGQLDRPAAGRIGLYAWADALDVARLPQALAETLKVRRGKAALEIWGNWEQETLAKLTGTLKLKDLELRLPPAERQKAALRPTYELDAAFDWESDAKRSSLRYKALGGRDADLLGDLTLHITRPEPGRVQTQGRAHSANLAGLIPLLTVIGGNEDRRLPYDLPPEALSGQLELLNFRFGMERGEFTEYAAGGRLQSLHTTVLGEVPGVESGALRFQISPQGGFVELEGGRLVVSKPDWFEAPLSADRARARIEWRPLQDRWWVAADDIEVSNAHLALNGNARFWLGADAPVQMALELTPERFELSELKRYLPRGRINPALERWVRKAFKGGSVSGGEVRVTGPLRRFPFRAGEGEIDVSLSLENLNLDYRTDWPPAREADGSVVIRNRRLEGAFAQAQVLDTGARSVGFAIDDVFEPVLDLAMESEGPLQDLLTYLRTAKLMNPDNRHLAGLTAQGRAGLQIDVRVPLLKRLGLQTQVSGTVRTEDAALDFPTLRQRIEGLRGEVRFDRQGGRAQDVAARWRGEPVRINAEPDVNGRTALDIRGRLSSKALLQDLTHPLFAAISGRSDWHARLVLPGFGLQHRGAPVDFALASQLKGMQVDLPPPLGKPADEERSLSVAVSFVKGREDPVLLRYGQALTAALEFQREGRGVRRADIMFGPGEAELPESGMRVRGHLNSWSYEAWRPHLWPEGGAPVLKVPLEDRAPLQLEALDVHVDRLNLGGYTLADVRTTARRVGARWRAQVSAPAVEGEIDAPLKLERGQTIVAELKSLALERGASAPAEPSSRPLDPRKLPNLRLHSEQFKVFGRPFTELHLEAQAQPKGLDIRRLDFEAPYFAAAIQGQWEAEGAAQRTDLTAVLSSGNLGRTLRDLGLGDNLIGSAGEFNLRLGWPAAPQRFSLAAAQGEGHVALKDGRLREIDPGGAGRLLGLINLEGTLLRRLRFNFGDLVNKGFSFDHIKGDLRLADTNVYTDNLMMSAPSADMQIKGRVGLQARDYDQEVLVKPKVTSGLPVVGLLLGGPGVGAVVFITDKILDHFDVGINSVAEIRYTVTGPWSKPVIQGKAQPNIGG